MVLIPSWEQPVAGNLSDKLGAFWELVIGSDASARSLGVGWEPGSQKSSLGAKKVDRRVVYDLSNNARRVLGSNSGFFRCTAVRAIRYPHSGLQLVNFD